jgi:hypothetical protein
MPGPTKLVVTMVPNATANVVNVPISSALQALDSTTPGSSQTGFSSVDIAIRNLFKSGVFTDGSGVWYSSHQIVSIVAQ